MPQMRIRVEFLHPIAVNVSMHLPVIPIDVFKALPVSDFLLGWWCPACGHMKITDGFKGGYDGKVSKECPDCLQREEAGQVAAVGDEAGRLVV
jgi:hypothetical protein